METSIIQADAALPFPLGSLVVRTQLYTQEKIVMELQDTIVPRLQLLSKPVTEEPSHQWEASTVTRVASS